MPALFKSFRTSGTTGKPKRVLLSDEVLALRVARLATTKGAEFATLRRILWLNAIGSAGHLKMKTWCNERGLDLFYEPQDADGVFGSPSALELLTLSGLRFSYVMCGGAPLDPGPCRTIRTGLLSECGVMYATYGLSECGTVAIATPSQIESIPGCVGRVFDDVSTKIVDGVLFVRTPTMSESEMHDGWICTADRAEFSADGHLILKGRAK